MDTRSVYHRGDSGPSLCLSPGGGEIGDSSWLRSSEYLMRVATLTTCNENMREAKTGDHKGRPYDGIVGVYFRSNDSRVG